MKLSELAQRFDTTLKSIYPKEEINALFFLAISHYLKVSRGAYTLHKENDISESDLVRLNALLTELKKGIPVQYVIGETVFFGLPFKVNPSVLIPRPETEELVDWVLNELQKSADENSSINLNLLDIGTGSGCIAISIKKNRPEIAVSAIDISTASLQTAQGNALLNNVNINFIEQDILHTSIDEGSIEYQVIVSNPPYITMREKADMHQNVVGYEPHQALFVSDENPLVFYEAIANFALNHLTEEGMLFFEINEHLGEETVRMLKDKNFTSIELRRDMQGKDRMILARR